MKKALDRKRQKVNPQVAVTLEVWDCVVMG